MDDRLTSIETKLRHVTETLTRLEARVRALESARTTLPAASPTTPRAVTPAIAEEIPAGAEAADLTGLLALTGRTFVVLGGAFLLRALTDSGTLPRGGGIALGLLYAVMLLGAADYAAGSGRRVSALFHGLASVIIGLPLVWEATTRFGFLGSAASASVLGVLTALALLVAWHRRLESVAAVATLGAIVAAIALLSATGAVAAFAVFLTLLGIGTLWVSYDCDWFWLRWPPALVADFVVAGLVGRALSQQQLDPPGTAIAVQLLLLALYLGSFAARTLVRHRFVIPFEVTQTVAALAVGLGGSVALVRTSHTGQGTLGAASLLLGAGAYAVAFVFVRRWHGLGANFYFYATLAVVLVLTGTMLVLPASALAVTLAVLAASSTWLGRRLAAVALTLHGALYVALAAAAAGLLALASNTLVGTVAGAWPMLTPAAWLTLFATGLCLAVPRPSTTADEAVLVAGARIVFAVLLALEVCAATLAVLGPIVAGGHPEPGVVATLRTGIVAGAAVLLALATRVERLHELGWLLFPALALGGLKLLVEDFRYSRPATLSIALALYGAALLTAPPLALRAGKSRSAAGRKSGPPG
jgi:hypothetical protein